MFYHTLVAPGLRPFADLATQLRHRSESVTKSYYRREAIPESWQVFISDRLERSGSISMEIALRAGVDSRFFICGVRSACLEAFSILTAPKIEGS